ncbi:DNA excision repair protein ERCC [Acrasis kona]|uniref:DNA excision repair protein ERCC n=1 Tax=Acrasis kona TaxID=1008807 RepID=A0AAW2YTV7_9EUKA
MTAFEPLAKIGKKGGHKFSVSCVEWYSQDNGMFMTGSFDKTLKVWDANRLEVAYSFKFGNPLYCLSVSPASSVHSFIAGGCDNPIVRLCDLVSGSSAHTLVGHKGSVWAIKWSPVNEHLLATGSTDQSIRLWDVRKPGWLMAFDQFDTVSNPKDHMSTAQTFSTKKLNSSTTVPIAHNGAVTALCFTPCGRYLLSTSNDGRMRLWNVITGKNTLVHYPDTVNKCSKGNQIAVSHDGNVVYHPNGNDIAAYDVHHGRIIKNMVGHYSGVNCCIFHPRDNELYSGASDHQIFVWTSRRVHDSLRRSEDGHKEQYMDKDNWSD